MKHRNLIRTSAAAIVLATASAAAGAGPQFPPPHLDQRASFARGESVATPTPPAWYFGAVGEARARLAASEKRQLSPYPSAYYFALIRGYANDTDAELAGFREDERALADLATGTDTGS